MKTRNKPMRLPWLATLGVAVALAGGHPLSAAENQRPAPPTDLTAEWVAPDTIRLAWRNQADDARWNRIEHLGRPIEEIEPDNYRFRALAYTGARDAEFMHQGRFTPGSWQTYRVSALNDAGASAPTAMVSIQIPAAPATADADAAPDDPDLKLFLGHFPSRRQLIVVADAARTAEQAAALAADKTLDPITIELEVTDIESGAVILNTPWHPLEWQWGPQRIGRGQWHLVTAEHAMPTPELDGIYQVTARLFSDGQPYRTITTDEFGQALQFHRQRFAWENNPHGVTDAVYPPFEPMRVSGRAVHTVLRDHSLNDSGLFDSVIARGRELLADGMTLNVLDADGQKRAWRDAAGRFTRTEPHAVVYEARAVMEGLTLRTVSSMEIDGAMKVEMELLPDTAGGGVIHGMTLDIPLRRELAKHQHVVVGLISRANPAQALQPWRTSRFVPYFWVGDMDRGLAWFADNEKGFALDGQGPVQEILLERDRAIMRVHFINTPTELTAARRIVFGLQASPTKPMPADFRAPVDPVPPHGGNNVYWAMRTWYSCRHPAAPSPDLAPDDPDWDPWHIIDVYDRARRARERIDKDYVDQWLQKRYGKMNAKDFATYRSHLYNRFNRVPPLDPTLVFIGFYAQSWYDPPWYTFQDEWDLRDFREVRRREDWAARRLFWFSAESRGPAFSGSRVVTTHSFRDWSAWNIREWYRRGLGIYDDNGYAAAFNLVSSQAFQRETADDGATEVVRSHNIWDTREYNKRNWLLLQQTQPETEFRLMKSHHMTGDMVLPIITWNTTALDLEWAAHGLFPPERLQVHATGRQVGCYPHAHQPIFRTRAGRDRPGGFIVTQRDAPEYAMAIRADWGMHAVHEILRGGRFQRDPRHAALETVLRDAGYGAADATIYNYWDADAPIRIEAVDADRDLEPVKWLAVEQDGRWLIVLVSWDAAPTEGNLRLERIVAGSARNAETDRPIPIEGNAIPFTLPAYGVKLIGLDQTRSLSLWGGGDQRAVLERAGEQVAVPLKGHLRLLGSWPAESIPQARWTVREAPADAPPVSFEDRSRLDTMARFALPGAYRLELAAVVDDLTATDTVLVTVVPPDIPFIR